MKTIQQLAVAVRRIILTRLGQFARWQHFFFAVSRTDAALICRFVDLFRNHYVSVDLIRVGPEGDGGYLIPDVIHSIDACFSPGVGSSSGFEEELWKIAGVPTFLADATVTHPNVLPSGVKFIPAMIGASPDNRYLTLSAWVDQSVNDSDVNLLLQMDIEGGEYNVLAYEDSAFLRRFSVMVIEFHSLSRLHESWTNTALTGIFSKLLRDFVVVHAHPNNCCPAVTIQGISVPEVLEVTFLRRDLLPNLASSKPIVLPHALDNDNVPTRPTLLLASEWWSPDHYASRTAVGDKTVAWSATTEAN